MPAVRTTPKASPPTKPINGRSKLKAHAEPLVAGDEEVVDLAQCDITYPLDSKARSAFKNSKGKALTPHQWAIYDFTRKVPVGKVTTYKDICAALGEGSPRSVGTALRNNPFAPFVPCHRVIASNHYIGGFYGEWGPDARTGTQCDRKINMLAQEGVEFDEKGYLVGGESQVWHG
ncbi:DNA binding methylated-DNA--cysteine S-methyltransferase [Ramaria rubella]|nr:DNA binding methylated-DNA--cysteine S-methyltransferase [Ramaria rubella]